MQIITAQKFLLKVHVHIMVICSIQINLTRYVVRLYVLIHIHIRPHTHTHTQTLTNMDVYGDRELFLSVCLHFLLFLSFAEGVTGHGESL